MPGVTGTPDPTPGAPRPPRPSLPAPALSESRVLADSHFPPRGRPDPEKGLVQTSLPSPRHRVPAVRPPRSGGAFCVPRRGAEPLVTQQARSTARAARTPGEGGPGTRGPGARTRWALSRELAARGGAVPAASRRHPAPLQSHGGEEQGKGAGARDGVGRVAYLCLRGELGGAGGPGRGKRVGGGGGERGSPCAVWPRSCSRHRHGRRLLSDSLKQTRWLPLRRGSSGRPNPWFKSAGCLRSKRYLCACAARRSRRKGGAGALTTSLSFGPPAYWQWSRRKGSSQKFSER